MNKKNTTSFYFVRHGESVNNKMKLVNGWTDCELTELGKLSAIEAGDILKEYPINRIVTSDLKRAVKTAEIIAKTIGFSGEIEKHEALRERNWGIYENKPIANRPGLDISPEKGEDWETFFNRVNCKIEELDLTDNTLFVGHAGVFRVIQKVFCNLENQEKISNCKPIKIEINENSNYTSKKRIKKMP